MNLHSVTFYITVSSCISTVSLSHSCPTRYFAKILCIYLLNNYIFTMFLPHIFVVQDIFVMLLPTRKTSHPKISYLENFPHQVEDVQKQSFSKFPPLIFSSIYLVIFSFICFHISLFTYRYTIK